MSYRLRTLLLVLPWALGGCPLSQVPDLVGNATTVPRVTATLAFFGAEYDVFGVGPAWSPDGSAIAFAAGPDADIWRVEPRSGATPVRVTRQAADEWGNGGHTPDFLDDGRLVYYVGWIGTDFDMHLMVAGAGQIENEPRAEILRRFNGADVGLSQNAALSPEVLSVSGDGTRTVAQWRASEVVYALDWGGGDLTSVNVSGRIGGVLREPVISRDGNRIAYADHNGQIAWLPFPAGYPTVVGAGSFPSWNRDGSLLGYLTDGGYVVRNIETGASTTYAVPELISIQYPALSRDGSRIAFRAVSDGLTGIGYGTLIDSE